jgi:hypothetical protein
VPIVIGAPPALELEPECELELPPPPPALDDPLLELPQATTNPATTSAKLVLRHLRRTLISSYLPATSSATFVLQSFATATYRPLLALSTANVCSWR